MEGTFRRYLVSPLFTFTVGAEKQEITVHSSALAGLSPALDALMNGEMIEAKTRHVDWSEVDVDTFVRLCEFAYFRNYTPPISRLIEGRSPLETAKSTKKKEKYKKRRSNVFWDDSIPEPTPEPEPEPESISEPAPEPIEPSDEEPRPEEICDDPEIAYKERSVWTGQLRDKFTSSLVIPDTESNLLETSFTPPRITGSWEDFYPVFLEQAKLYVLADKYGIESLRRLVLCKLHQTLSSFKLYETGVGTVIEFVRFVYSNTPPNIGSEVDAMRNLVTRYVVSVLGQIGETECFQDLLEDGGPFVADFWRIIWSVEEKPEICD
ncbi:unnamed protein product [Penicillium salamii]|nr:unnamed protein product [Penicillium salamii]CAG8057316.1 unnamed protein product [Penicillium salamii]